jgi:hypothetical protein
MAARFNVGSRSHPKRGRPIALRRMSGAKHNQNEKAPEECRNLPDPSRLGFGRLTDLSRISPAHFSAPRVAA